jgi:hypothetical protein
MSRDRIAFVIGGYFLAALAFAVVEMLLKPVPNLGRIDVAMFQALGGAVALFVLSGVLPLIGWAFDRFRAERASSVLIWWAAVGVVFGILMFIGNRSP